MPKISEPIRMNAKTATIEIRTVLLPRMPTISRSPEDLASALFAAGFACGFSTDRLAATVGLAAFVVVVGLAGVVVAFVVAAGLAGVVVAFVVAAGLAGVVGVFVVAAGFAAVAVGLAVAAGFVVAADLVGAVAAGREVAAVGLVAPGRAAAVRDVAAGVAGRVEPDFDAVGCLESFSAIKNSPYLITYMTNAGIFLPGIVDSLALYTIGYNTSVYYSIRMLSCQYKIALSCTPPRDDRL